MIYSHVAYDYIIISHSSRYSGSGAQNAPPFETNPQISNIKVCLRDVRAPISRGHILGCNRDGIYESFYRISASTKVFEVGSGVDGRTADASPSSGTSFRSVKPT